MGSSSSRSIRPTLRVIISQMGLRYNYKTEPFAHQRRALKKVYDLKGRAGLLMEMGTGKTKVAIDWAGIGYYNMGTRKILVVAPLSVLGVWTRQIKQHSGAPARIFRLTGSSQDKIKLFRRIMRAPDDGVLTYVTINYESIWRENDRGTSIKDLFISWVPDLVIFDESHRIKSPTSKQSRAASLIGKGSKQVLLLTGTPITKAPLDIFAQFRAMNPDVFGDNWYAFKFTYGVWGGFGRYQLRGYRHLKDLITKVRNNSFRIKKEQCLDLPPKLFETVPITLPDRILKLYAEMAKEMIIEIEDTHATAAIVLVKLLRLSQITSGFIKDVEGKIRILDDSKLQTCLDLLSDLVEDGHKVVVFVRFREDIRRLSEALEHRKIAHGILSGSVPDYERDSLIDEFQTGSNMKVFVAQIQTGSEGIELFAASAAIFYSLSYNAMHYWQAQDRLHRPGQVRSVTYYHLVAPKTIDSVVLQVLKEKGKLAETIIHKPGVLLGLTG